MDYGKLFLTSALIVGDVEHVILGLDDIVRKLDIIIMELEDVIPNNDPSSQQIFLILSSQWIQMIKTICYYEKSLLFNCVYATKLFNYSYYNLQRLQFQKEVIEYYISQIRQGHEELEEKIAKDKIEHAASIANTSLGLFDQVIEIYNVWLDNTASEDTKPTGELKCSEENGHGLYVFPDGEIFMGQCMNSLPGGYGTVFYPDGSKYTGQVDKMVYNGQGTFAFANGYYEGEFKNDKFDGFGTIDDFCGNAYSGYWENGVLVNEDVKSGDYLHHASGISLPEVMGGLSRESICNYELTKAGLGISVNYQADSRMNATVYIYDSGISNIPDDLDSKIVKDQFNQVIQEIFMAYEKGVYEAVVKLTEGKMYLANSAESLEVLSALLMISTRKKRRFSHIYLSVFNNHFLKIRYSYDESVEAEGIKTLRLFSDEVDKLLRNTAMSE